MNVRLPSCLAAVVVLGASVVVTRAQVPTAEGPELPGPATTTDGQDRPGDAGATAGPDAPQPAGAEKPARAPPRSIYDQAFDKVVDRAQNGWLEDPLKHLEGDM